MDTLSDLRQKLFASLDHVDALPVVLRHLTESVRASGGFFNVVGGSLAEPLFSDTIALGVDVARAGAVERELREPDPWSKGYIEKFGHSVGHVCLGSELCTADEIANSKWSSFIREQDLVDVLMVTFEFRLPEANHSRIAVATLHRSGGSQLFSQTEKQLMSELLSDLKRIAIVTYSIRHARTRRYLLDRAMSVLADAVVIVDEYKKHVFSNQASRQHFIENERDSSAPIEWKLASMKSQIAPLIDRVLSEQLALQTSITRQDDPPLILDVSPILVEAGEQNRFLTDHVVITIKDPTRAIVLRRETLQMVYGLTGAESEVAIAVFQGSDPKDIARDRGVSPQTIRSQIKTIYQKTDVSSRSQLALKLSALVTQA